MWVGGPNKETFLYLETRIHSCLAKLSLAINGPQEYTGKIRGFLILSAVRVGKKLIYISKQQERRKQVVRS
jgi:hypothetical protein